MSKKPKKEQLVTISSPALDIAIIELNRLRERAISTGLSLDETRQYDLLCKNLNLLNGDPTSIEAEFTRRLSKSDEKKLIDIAKQIEKAPKTDNE